MSGGGSYYLPWYVSAFARLRNGRVEAFRRDQWVALDDFQQEIRCKVLGPRNNRIRVKAASIDSQKVPE